MKKEENKLTEGSIIKSLLTLAIPIVSSNILQTAYQLIDTFWVGRLGADAIAAVSLSFPILFLLISAGGGMAVAGTILVAQYKGKKEQGNVDHVATQTLISMAVISIFISFTGYILSPVIMSLMGASPSVITDAINYLQISFLGIIFLFGYFVFQSLMRGIGDAKTPLYIVSFTVLLNLILDPLFILGYGPIPSFGVGGAAIVTVLTQGIASVIGVAILFSGKYGIKFKTWDIKPDIKLITKMFSIGLPASIEHSARAMGITFMAFLVSSFGTMVVAAYGIGTRILSFIIIPALGLSMATSALVGQNIGAGKVQRAEDISKLSATLAFITLTLLGIIIFAFAEPIAAIFIPADTSVIEASALFIKIMSLTFGFIGTQITLNGTFKGSGNTLISMILAIISLWILRFPIAYGLSKHTSLSELGIWLAFPIANIIAAFITVYWFITGTWKKKKLTEEVSEETVLDEGYR